MGLPTLDTVTLNNTQVTFDVKITSLLVDKIYSKAHCSQFETIVFFNDLLQEADLSKLLYFLCVLYIKNVCSSQTAQSNLQPYVSMIDFHFIFTF